MATLACPQCASPIVQDGVCAQCGLDASLLVHVRQAAERLARQAAKAAGAGAWQPAYEAAAESLRLARHDNDLAAFVLLTATLGGARGPMRSIPRPRPEALPASLAPLAGEVLAAAARLRELAKGAPLAGDVPAALDGLAGLPAEAAAVGGESPAAPSAAEAKPGRRPPRWVALAAAATVLALVLGALAGACGGAARARERAQARIVDLEQRLKTSQARAAARQETPVATVPTDAWLSAVQKLAAAPPGPRPATQADFRDQISRGAWNEGRRASARGEYEKAGKLLELAVQGPRESDYWDDALYYLGKTYHRLGQREQALAAYHRLEQEAPASTLVPEAHRLLVRLERGQEVDR